MSFIYTDGSSQTRHRHRPPEWIAVHDISDSWAFAVFAEQYSLDPDQPSKLHTILVQPKQALTQQRLKHFSGQVSGGSPNNAPFRHLREVFQTLKAMLPGDSLRVEHTRSHAGDPHNEFVDWLAKQEGQSSLYLKRQHVHMPIPLVTRSDIFGY